MSRMIPLVRYITSSSNSEASSLYENSNEHDNMTLHSSGTSESNSDSAFTIGTTTAAGHGGHHNYDEKLVRYYTNKFDPDEYYKRNLPMNQISRGNLNGNNHGKFSKQQLYYIRDIEKLVSGPYPEMEMDTDFGSSSNSYDNYNEEEIRSIISDSSESDLESDLEAPSSIPNEFHFYRSLKELIQTEESFKNDLSLCLSVYKKLLLTCNQYKNILSNIEIDLIFSNLAPLIDVIETFLIEIKSRLSSYSNPIQLDLKEETNQDINSFKNKKYINRKNKVEIIINDKQDYGFPSLFLQYINNFENFYEIYCQKHVFQMTTLQKVIRFNGPMIHKWLNEANFYIRSKTDSWSLESLLIKPIQRMLKYKLLIEKMYNNCDEICSSDGKEILKEIIEKLDIFTMRVNHTLSIGNPNNNEHDEYETRNGNGKLLKKLFHQSNLEYVNLTTQFKNRHKHLLHIKTSMKSSLESYSNSTNLLSNLSDIWNTYFKDVEISEFNGLKKPIKNNRLTHAFFNKVNNTTLNEALKRLKATMKMKVFKPLDKIMELTEGPTKLIQKHKKYRSLYHDYIKHGTKNSSSYSDQDLSLVQEYICIENMLKNELSTLIEYLDQLVINLLGVYTKVSTSWLLYFAGEMLVSTPYERIIDGYYKRKGYIRTQLHLYPFGRRLLNN